MVLACGGTSAWLYWARWCSTAPRMGGDRGGGGGGASASCPRARPSARPGSAKTAAQVGGQVGETGRKEQGGM
eukprot:1445380-Rhodomonas_salina.2